MDSPIFQMKGNAGPRIAVGVFLALTFVLIIVRETMARKARQSQHGSVADLVRRGQLKSHRRGVYVLCDRPWFFPSFLE